MAVPHVCDWTRKGTAEVPKNHTQVVQRIGLAGSRYTRKHGSVGRGSHLHCGVSHLVAHPSLIQCGEMGAYVLVNRTRGGGSRKQGS